MSSFQTQLRSNLVSELAGMSGHRVAICGWITQPMKAHGAGFGSELRDRSGSIELIISSDSTVATTFEGFRVGDVVRLLGLVHLDAGNYRLEVTQAELLSRSQALPFNPWSSLDQNISAERLAALRFLQLRRSDYQRRLELKSRAVTAVRSQLFRIGFLEVDLPILDHHTSIATQSFVVPMNGGSAFSLSTTPQVYKHLMIAGGTDRFFQFSRVFRRERSYSNWHQPEFSSLDIEMAFVSDEDIFHVVDELLSRLFKGILSRDLATPIKRLSYDEAILKYGTDTPDLRYGLEISDISDILVGGASSYFQDILDRERIPRGAVRAFHLPSSFVERLPSRRLELLPLMNPFPNQVQFDWLRLQSNGRWDGSVQSALPSGGQGELVSRFNLAPGDVLILVSGGHENFVANAAGQARCQFAKELGLVRPDVHAPVWITRFPYFGFDPSSRSFVPIRHPLTLPTAESLSSFSLIPSLAADVYKPAEYSVDGEGGGSPPGVLRDRIDYATEAGSRYIGLRSLGFELVLNGCEIGSGGIRVHEVGLQEKLLSMFGYSRSEAYAQFGGLLNALRFGIPPHGGLAIGVDRLLATLCGEGGLESFIPFPKNSRGECPVSQSPSVLEPNYIRSLLGSGR